MNATKQIWDDSYRRESQICFLIGINISRADVKNGIATGGIIEDYPEDYPNPSCLIFGYNVNGRFCILLPGVII